MSPLTILALAVGATVSGEVILPQEVVTTTAVSQDLLPAINVSY